MVLKILIQSTNQSVWLNLDPPRVLRRRIQSAHIHSRDPYIFTDKLSLKIFPEAVLKLTNIAMCFLANSSVKVTNKATVMPRSKDF